jgi:hypothetical protein
VTSAGRLLTVNAAACLLLLAQYLLGMAVNVYVVLPGRHPGSGASNYFGGAASGLAWVISHGPGWAAAHTAFGLALAVAALASVGLARRQDGRLVTGLSVLGALAIVGAGFNGASFLDYGHAFSSMIMAGLWALALACYLTGAVLAAVRVTRLPLADRLVAEAPAAGQARLPDRLPGEEPQEDDRAGACDGQPERRSPAVAALHELQFIAPLARQGARLAAALDVGDRGLGDLQPCGAADHPDPACDEHHHQRSEDDARRHSASSGRRARYTPDRRHGTDQSEETGQEADLRPALLHDRSSGVRNWRRLHGVHVADCSVLPATRISDLSGP